MKKSNLILLGLIVAILATLMASAVTLRVKMDKQAYAKMEPPANSFTDVPLGAFSVVEVDGLDAATIVTGPANVLHLPKRESERPTYRVSMDTLYVSAPEKGNGNLQLHLTGVKSVWFKEVNVGSVAGFSGDSLSINGFKTNMTISGSTLGRLRLRADSCATVDLKDIDCKEFLPGLADVELLSVDSCNVRSIRGRWDEASSLKLDGYSLNHVEKIDHEQ